MSEDVQATVNVLSQSVSAWAESVTRLGGRLDDLEASVGRLRAWAEAHEIRANAAKPSPMDERRKVVEEREIWTRLATTQEEFRRVEKERNESWMAAGKLRNQVCEAEQRLKIAGAAYDEALRDAAETKKLLEDARREVQSHAKDRSEALNKVESLTRELKAALASRDAASKRLNERAEAHDKDLQEMAGLERQLVKAREDRESERNAKERSFEVNEHLQKVNEGLKKQIEDLQGALAEARKETPAGVQDQFRLEKLGRLFDSLFAHEDDLTDETREFWASLETAGWLRPSRVEMIVRMQEAAQAELKKFKTDENTLRVQLLERIQHLENEAGGLRERVRELTARAVEASEESRQARIAEDIQRVEKEKAFERVQYLEKALANLSTAHEGLLAAKEKALADKEHAVCPYCHRCATCGTA